VIVAASHRRPGGFGSDITSFVGRHDEIADVRKLLTTARLVTLTGVGGVGKTRLALRVASMVRRRFPGGVYLVDIAPLRDGGLLAHTVAMALGIPTRSAAGPLADLTEFLLDKRLLLVMDNCEHLVRPCAEVVEVMLRAAPKLRVLATSRQPLGLAGEHIWPVRPLSTPERDDPADNDYPALALFAERGATVRPGFALTRDNYAAVARICRQLDGLPLAIELAAVRLHELSLDELVTGMTERYRPLPEDNPPVLPRHLTLRAAIDWSFDLCTAAEQRMWRRAAVFAGAFDLDDAEQVCADADLDSDAVYDLVAALVDKSILGVEPDAGRARYRLLDTVRQYGLDKLRVAGEDGAVRRRHRDWYLRLAEQSAAECFGNEQLDWFTRLQSSHPDLRTALEYCLTTPGESQHGQRLAAALWFYWLGCGFLPEGRYWSRKALDTDQRPTTQRVRALWTDSWMAAAQGDLSSATSEARECREQARQIGDDAALVHASHVLGIAALVNDDLPTARALLSEAHARQSRIVADQELAGELALTAAQAQVQLSFALSFHGEPGDAAAVAEECRQQCARHGEQWTMSYARYGLALAGWKSGAYPGAAAHARAAIRIKRTFNDLLGLAMSLDLLAWIAAAEGRAERAAVLCGASARLWKPMAQPRFGSRNWTEPHERCQQRCRAALGDVVFDAAVRRGAEFTLQQTLAYALTE
jgi:predicted ATPase